MFSSARFGGEVLPFEKLHCSLAMGKNNLTVRQRQVLRLVAEGRSLKEIATALGLAVRTVVFHKSNLMEKLGMHTTAELTRYAIKHRIIVL
jgi:DNA-binding NarL/FixJ family response regulator